MNERHPLEHFHWGASIVGGIIFAFFVYEGVRYIPIWFFEVTGFVFAITLCVVFPIFWWIFLSGYHKIHHTDIPKQVAQKPRQTRARKQIEEVAHD